MIAPLASEACLASVPCPMATAAGTPRVGWNVEQWRREVERCHREIAEAEHLLRSGHPDVAGLCLALADWSAELKILLQEERELPMEGMNS